jgi:phage FluMu protein Com
MEKSSTAQCARAVALFRGLYARVAQDLGVDASYISRIAHGKRKSKVAEKALTREFNKVVSVMSNGIIRSSRKSYVEITLRCPRCKTVQEVHIAARAGLSLTGSERIPCINCNNHFKVTIPGKIIRGPFPA